MSLYTNLVAYYALDETSGTRYDSTANDNDLDTVGGSGGYHAGLFGNAAYFDGSGDYLKRSAAIGSGANVSYSFWVKPLSDPGAGSSYQYILHYLDGYLYVRISQQNGYVVGVGIGAGSNATTATLTGSAWNHVAVTIEGSEVKVYIAADLKNTWTMTPGDPDANSLTLGSEGTAVPNADMDELAIYSRVLNQTEITRLYNSGTGYTYPLPIDYSTDATVQTYVLTGIDILIGRGISIIAETASYALTWIDTIVQHGRHLIAATQTYALSWIDLIVRKIRWNQPSKNSTSFSQASKNSTSYTQSSKNITTFTQPSKK